MGSAGQALGLEVTEKFLGKKCKNEERKGYALVAMRNTPGHRCAAPQALLIKLTHPLGLAITPITEFNVKVANGERQVCKEGPVECDWKKMMIKFLWEGVSYVIKSSSINPIQEVAMQRLEQDMQGGGELFAIMQNGEDHVGVSTVLAELQPLLQEFH
ncbi:hypothetical protein CMV_002099 [Castanea mollissima]|uniref:Uncharacterized protein n=1 Tax=Castanea mollissima TaxID=60419 RepID=A0A8J4W3X7_9ROSI|nr:hypothetical protein CMV_002099 [Castanea mollissima]